MDRSRTLLALAVAVIILVLLGALALSFMSLTSADNDVQHYQEQQKQAALAIEALHRQDMLTAQAWWAATNPAESRQLQDEGIMVKADYIDTPYYTAVLDPADPYYVSFGPAGEAEPGEVIVWLGQYFAGNMTKVPGWSADYRINATTHAVEGFTAALAQQIAYDNYVANLEPGICGTLGVAAGAVQGYYPVTLDTSYLPDPGTWLDVTEYRYALRNTDQPVYLTIKTYINGSTGDVTGTDVSQPYYTTASSIIH